MGKKIGYLIVGILAVAVFILVYFILTKGYSGRGVSISSILTSSAPAATSGTEQEVGTVTSAKISLVVTSPKDGDSLDTTNVTVKGKTTPNADVFVDDQSGKADASGNFSISVGLDEGENQIVVSANDSVGNATEQDLTVNVVSFQ
ncbi:MAG: hypothetical protein ABSC49_00065 [Candidatus Microgenomates bacterium]|jgi:hypothetical protein